MAQGPVSRYPRDSKRLKMLNVEGQSNGFNLCSAEIKAAFE